MPVLLGKAPSRRRNASRPPAEAPMPTMGKEPGGRRLVLVTATSFHAQSRRVVGGRPGQSGNGGDQGRGSDRLFEQHAEPRSESLAQLLSRLKRRECR